MATTIVQIVHGESAGTIKGRLGDDLGSAHRYEAVGRLQRLLGDYSYGGKNGTVQLCLADSTGAKATGTLTLSSASGVVGGKINGTLVTVTWATSDTNSATLLKNAINNSQDPLIKGVVTATSSSGVVTVSSVALDSTAETITLVASGTGVTANTATLTGSLAVAASGTLTMASSSGTVGGTIGGTLVTVTWASSDTASSTALAAAINANTTVNKWVTAAAVGAVTTVTAIDKGALGNNVTLVASGTNVTASGAKLTGGLSRAFTSYSMG